MKYIKKTVLCILLAVFLLTPVFADLSDFRDKVEEAEETEDPPRRGSSSRSDNDDDNFFWLRFMMEFLFRYGLFISYGPYPYSPEGYILQPQWERDVFDRGIFPRSVRSKIFSLSTSVEGTYLNNLGLGGWARLTGPLLKIIGPEADYFALFDGMDRLTGYRLGGSLYLLQTNPFTLKFYVQYLNWGGILDREGSAIGVEILSFPAAPVSLRVRWGDQVFTGTHVNELEAEIGVQNKRVNVYGGYRSWRLMDEMNTLDVYRGFFLGVKCFF
jgi:hypothetical protein